MKRRLVLIEWLDSSSGVDGWRRIDQIEQQIEPLRCHSVGWIVQKTATTTTLVAHISGTGQGVYECGKGDITIPNCAIVRTRKLK